MEKVGEFEIKCGTIRVTDPCYDVTTWCAGTFEALPGTYSAFLCKSDEGNWGTRVSELRIYHKDFGHVEPDAALTIDVGVDSGQAGFFDADLYKEHQGGEYDDKESFYGKACSLTRYQSDDPKDYKYVMGEDATPERTYTGPELPGGGTLEWGVVSSSGFGDGGYTCYVGKNTKGEVVSAKIVFIGDETDEDEDDE